MKKKNEGSAKATSELYDLANDLHFLVNREHQIIGDELEQMRSLVSDAIKILVKSFNSLNIHMMDQSDLVKKVIAIGSDDADKNKNIYGEEYFRLGQEMKQNLAETVRSFQFEDIVQQLVMHCRSRAENMEQLFARLDQGLACLKNAKGDEAVKIVKDMRNDVISVRKILEKENPVKQKTMLAGGVELF